MKKHLYGLMGASLIASLPIIFAASLSAFNAEQYYFPVPGAINQKPLTFHFSDAFIFSGLGASFWFISFLVIGTPIAAVLKALNWQSIWTATLAGATITALLIVTFAEVAHWFIPHFPDALQRNIGLTASTGLFGAAAGLGYWSVLSRLDKSKPAES